MKTEINKFKKFKFIINLSHNYLKSRVPFRNRWVVCRIVFIINSFAKFEDIGRVNHTFVFWISHFSYSFVFGIKALWIRIGHVVTQYVWGCLTMSSSPCNRWCKNREFLPSLRAHHLSTISCKLTRSLTHYSFIFTLFTHWSPIQSSASSYQFPNFKQ